MKSLEHVPSWVVGLGAIELGQHWGCYDAFPLFDPDVIVNLLDQFHLESNVIVGPGRYLCNPVEKNNEGHPVSRMSTWRDTRSSTPHWVIFISGRPIRNPSESDRRDLRTAPCPPLTP
jgi:hypothetical protein